jgi:hypothetical protein
LNKYYSTLLPPGDEGVISHLETREVPEAEEELYGEMTEQPVRLTRRVTIPAGTRVDIPVSMALPVDGHVQVAPIPGRLQQMPLVPHSIQVFTKRGTLDKNTVVASGALIFLPSEEGFIAEMESWEKQAHHGDGSGPVKVPKDKTEETVEAEEEVSEEWIVKEFQVDS